MANTLFIFIVSLSLLIKGATLATKYSARLAENFRLSKYTVGFIVIAVISILPETFISVNSALEGVPSFGLGVLFGSNVADLTLIFALIILSGGRGLKIESKILKNRVIYPFLLLLPLILGFDGRFSRLEGAAITMAGAIFYYISAKDGIDDRIEPPAAKGRYKSLTMLFVAMGALLVGSHFTVTSATSLAGFLGVSPVLIGMLIVGLGTTMPEFIFSLKSAKRNDDSLAVGDLLGTVLADATVVVGILALVRPFSFPVTTIYVTGTFMVAASIILFYFMRSGKMLSRREAYMLLLFWVFFALTEFIANS
jgi:cation:H+ antiporter